MKFIICLFLFAAALLTGGCSLTGNTDRDPSGGVLITLDPNYVPAVGYGFHWTVAAEAESEESRWNLQVAVNNAVVCGSEFGLPTDIYLGYWDMKSAGFFFADQELPQDAVPVKITFVFAGGTVGNASGFIHAPEGENILVSQMLLLDKDTPVAALFEVNASAGRRLNTDTAIKDTNILIRRNPADYVPANAVQLFISRALEPGQIPVGLPETLSEERSEQGI